MLLLALYISIGLVAGISAGLLGVGGGLIFLPIAKFYFIDHLHYPPSFLKVIIATSTIIIVANSLSATIQHRRKRNLDLSLLPYFVIACVVGSRLGVLLIDVLPVSIVKCVLAAFLFISAVRILRGRKIDVTDKPLHRREHLQIGGIGLGISTLSSMLGLGGGALMTPVLNIGFRQPIKKSIGTASMFTLTVAASAGTYYLLQPTIEAAEQHAMFGYVDLKIALFVAIGGIIGSWTGARLLHKVPVVLIQKIFAGMLLIAAVKMLF